ncbi:hypothetical protein IU438_28785 [Nocardia cyriacigeorgica]|uniref:hypothetical protein n=1 Tax=Nocardia cyriacigeorgica TaxID=135487 RepID=UPI0018931172|nr:hypothetical protein [Nocardia cyriacigeorgica]MBF6399769.1 hypothetical protein [Nocardia cyriacigeorgica]MBF6405402.1 hypothetical protein [Nocardia cyriacigeorgica]
MELIGYRIARRERVDGPWIADYDGGTVHENLDDATTLARRALSDTGIRYELELVYAEPTTEGTE